MLEVWAELLGCYALQGYDGSLPARAREKCLTSFQEGSGQRILVATDSVARGLHINGVEAVINVDFPPTVVEYLHRLGPTGSLRYIGISYERLEVVFHHCFWLQQLEL